MRSQHTVIEAIHRAAEGISIISDVPLSIRIEPACSLQQINECEKQINCVIPIEIKNFLLNVSSEIELEWNVRFREQEYSALFGDQIWSSFRFGVHEFQEEYENWSAWKYEKILDHSYTYDDLFPLVSLGNGDYLAHAVTEEIIYINHDDINLDRRLSKSVLDFFKTWATLGCPGPDWDCIEEFFDEDQQELSLSKDSSRKWLSLIHHGH
jgi:hypothetical protein